MVKFKNILLSFDVQISRTRIYVLGQHSQGLELAPGRVPQQ
jgi:hypothetical protein